MSFVVLANKPETPCASCVALYGYSCCQLRPDGGQRFPLTVAEARRIARTTGTPVSEAVEVQDVPDEGVEALRTYGADVANLVVGGKGLFLPVDQAGYCKYLHYDRCSIAGVKPHICAMFPFKKVSGKWTIGALVNTSGYCYGQDASGLDVGMAMRMFSTTPQDLDVIWARWQQDLKSHGMHMRNLRTRKR